MKYHFKKAFTAFILAGAMLFNSLSVFASSSTVAEDMQYLNSYFQIGSISETVTAEEFCSALEKISDTELTYSTEYTGMVQLLQPILQAAGMEELALTFPEQKYSKILSQHNIKLSLDTTTSQYAACALTTNLIEPKDLTSTTISKSQAVRVLTAIADATGQGRNFLGYSSDADIYSKLTNTWNSFEIFSDEVLDDIGSKAVQNKITTGYNLKKQSYDARFVPELTLRYGHDDIKHANQIIGLLQSEGIVAKVQLEPKISIYEYLLDWGPVPEPEPRYEVKQFSDDLYLVYAVEYDLALEFESTTDKSKFDTLILKYAKKSGENADAEGLLYGSWWQPLYTSTTPMTGNYRKIVDNIITNGEYSIHPFCLDSNATNVKQQLKELNPSINVTQKTLWCDEPFYRYLSGNDYQ